MLGALVTMALPPSTFGVVSRNCSQLYHAPSLAVRCAGGQNGWGLRIHLQWGTLAAMDITALAKRRTALGLSARDLAALVGVSPVTVWRWEARGIEPIPTVARVLEAELTRLENAARLQVPA